MYMNRLQVDDYRAMFSRAGHAVSLVETTLDADLLDQLRDEVVPLVDRFAQKTPEVLATLQSLLVARPLTTPRSQTRPASLPAA